MDKLFSNGDQRQDRNKLRGGPGGEYLVTHQRRAVTHQSSLHWLLVKLKQQWAETMRSTQAPTHVQVVVYAELGRKRLPSLIRQRELDPGIQAELKVLAYVLAEQAKGRPGRADVGTGVSL